MRLRSSAGIAAAATPLRRDAGGVGSRAERRQGGIAALPADRSGSGNRHVHDKIIMTDT